MTSPGKEPFEDEQKYRETNRDMVEDEGIAIGEPNATLNSQIQLLSAV